MNGPKEVGTELAEVASRPEPKPRPSEWAWVLLICGAFLAFNLATYNFYPAVWVDEVSFAEPAVNLVKYGSFTTTVFEFQPSNTFPVVNCPLFTMALVPWLSLTGTGVLAVRSFNYALMAAAAMLLWVASWKFNLVKTPFARILLVGLLHLGYGMSYSFRCCRPDILGLFALLLLLLAFKIRRRPFRELSVLILAALLVWIGLQVALFAWCAALLAWLFLRKIRLREILVMAIGLWLGAGSLSLFLWSKGVLSYFLVGVVGLLGKHYAHAQHLTLGQSVHKVLHSTFASYFDDFSTLVLSLGLILLLAKTWKRLAPATRGFALCCIGLMFGIPLIFDVVGHYAFYYSYMRFVPASLAFLAVYSELVAESSAVPCWLKSISLAVIAAAALLGLPLRLGLTLACCEVAPRENVQHIVQDHLRAEDVVFTEYASFFEVKQAARVVYDPYSSSELVGTRISGGRDLAPDEKRAVSVMIIQPEKADLLSAYFGGQWQSVSPLFGDRQDFSKLARLPLIGRKFASYAAQPQNIRYQLQVFRRAPPQ